jgi:lipopolysaccharide/colanic/teichoic acid biosynthesis glycosyltransferase
VSGTAQPRLHRLVAFVDSIAVLGTVAACLLIERAAGWGDQQDGWAVGSAVIAVVVAAVWSLSLLLTDSRDDHLLLVGSDYYARAIRSTFLSFAITAVGVLAIGIEGARAEIVLGFPIGVVLVVVGRWVVRNLRLRRLRAGGGDSMRQRVLTVVGNGDARVSSPFSAGGFRVFEDVGTVVPSDVDRVVQAALDASASLVFVARDSGLTPRQVQLLGWRLDNVRIGMCIEPSSSFIRPGKTLLLPHPSTTVLLVRTVHLSTRDRFIKRTADLVLTIALAPVLVPLALLAAVAVVADDGFPVLYRQQRVGRNGRRFTIYKLRTMHRDADAQQPPPRSPKPSDDPRCTRVGRVLRRWSIDEIPQLWCVLTGSMSLVGPRPRLEPELADSPEEFRRLEARPGISGLWQTSGRANLSFEEADLLDVEYVDNWTLIGDLVILARTVRTVLGRHGAY